MPLEPQDSRSQQPTALSLLIAWANEQDNWVRAIVVDVIQARHRLSDDRIVEHVESFLREKELIEGSANTVAPIGSVESDQESEEALLLTDLKEVTNVNVIASGQEISFNPRMTVLFGENAAGKSGYVRVIKRVASVRTEEPILPNVHDAAATGEPSAKLTYKLGDSETELNWQGESGVHPLTGIDVFDARGAVILVDEELLTYTYTPTDLALFRIVHDSIERLKNLVEQRRQTTLPSGNPFLQRFSRDSSVYPKIETLGPATDIHELEELSSVTDEEEQSLEALRDRVQALGSRTASDRVQVATTERDLYSEVKTITSSLGQFSIYSYAQTLGELQAARQTHSEVTERAFAQETIPSVLSEAWRAFITAGETYIREMDDDQEPIASGHCPYCRQSLDSAALELVRKYRAFCNDDSAMAVERLERQLLTLVRPVVELNFTRTVESLERIRDSFEDPTEVPEIITRSLDLLGHAQETSSQLANRSELTFTESPIDLAELQGLLDGKLTELNETIDQLTQEASERQRLHAEESAKLRNLEARLELKNVLPQIQEHVGSQKWCEKVRTILARFQALQRSLTDQSKVASEQLLNQDFQRLFEDECTALRAPAVSLDFPGRRGEAARRKTLVRDHKLTEILSEGEQKVIALADFIAEASLRRKPTPLVFDDPVNSLDYKRLEHVVSRLVTLSAQRQVIVFTHSILLARDILARFEHNRDQCLFYNISESAGVCGFVSPGSGPRVDTFSDYRSRINTQIQLASQESPGETQNALIERAYELMRGASEAAVETDLLRGVTRRYQPNVMMTQLPNIRCDRLEVAISAIVPIFEKCCRYIASHSQPLETLSVRPSLDDLRTDWASLQEARSTYIN